MPRQSVRARRRTLGCLTFIITALAVAAVVLVCAIVITDRVKPGEVTTEPTGGNFVDVSEPAEDQLVLKADSFSEDYLPRDDETPQPTPEETATPTAAPTLEAVDMNAALRPAAQGNDMLPIFKKANTTEKVIAITLDECSGTKITQSFVDLANHYGAKLTLFPTGENVMKEGMGALLKQCVFTYGFEVENRGYSELARVYQYIDSLMVQEIWKQSVALNFVLGVKYEPHFYRMYGGLGESDRRTHAYLKQQGYYGIAHWTVSCSGMEPEKIPAKLSPGAIYHFKSTAEDGERMTVLMQAAREAGYRMVTMNELFGYPANNYYQVSGSLLAETMPTFTYDGSQYYDLFPGDAAWAVALVQQRLIQLGYLPENSADGIFGEATSEGVRMFQAASGQAASGAADINTQKRLFSPDALENPNPLVIAPKDGGDADFDDLLEEDESGLVEDAPDLVEEDTSGLIADGDVF